MWKALGIVLGSLVMAYPLVFEIAWQNPLQVFARFAEMKGAVFLDSAYQSGGVGRYSFIGVNPFQILSSKNGEIEIDGETFPTDPFSVLEKQLSLFSLETHADLPPFQGGLLGYFGYDLYQHLETIKSIQVDERQFPDLLLGFYDLVLAFDLELKRAWIFSSGYPEREESLRLMRAENRYRWLLRELENNNLLSPISEEIISAENITANFTSSSYQEAVAKVVEYILAGDIFEANISQCFKAKLPQNLPPFDLYRRLRLINPAPFAAYLCFDKAVLISASPERFLQLKDNNVEARPIKGTRPRGKSPEQDRLFANELLASEKDRAENIMIVDLLRNDLSRVCCDHSVAVSRLCGLESYATVHHLVSVVEGKLRDNLQAVDLLRATFPGGSITGAPKIRAMEIIAEIEPTHRGPYCGSIGYIGFDGNMDCSILIRTFAYKDNIVTFQAGGAVVVDSDPLSEYEETLTKARALINALIKLPETYDFVD